MKQVEEPKMNALTSLKYIDMIHKKTKEYAFNNIETRGKLSLNTSLLWSSVMALSIALPAQAGMLGAPTSSQRPESSQSQPSENFSSATQPSLRNTATAPNADANTQKMLENYGMSPKEAQTFLENTQNMSPSELQSYLSSLKNSLDSGSVQPSDIDNSLSPDYQPYPHTSVRGQQKSLAQQQNEEAFDSMMADILPLSPDQIHQVQKFYDLSLQAKATSPTPPPSPNFISLPVNLEPGSQAPVIRLAAGFVSTLLFVDRTGAPWPITAYSLGDSKNFNIQWDNQSNTMFVQSTKKYVHANMAVRLVNLNTPVMVTLVSGQKQVDFRVDLQLQSRGPEAFPAVVEKSPYSTQVNVDMINILDGIPPQGSLKLNVHGAPDEAWMFQKKIYYRTKLTLLSPAWLATVSSPDGTHVYEIMPTPYLLASKDGKTINIKLTGL